LSHFKIKEDTIPKAVCTARDSIWTIGDLGILTTHNYTYSDTVHKYSSRESVLSEAGAEGLCQILKFAVLRKTHDGFLVAFVKTSLGANNLSHSGNKKTLVILDVSLDKESSNGLNVTKQGEFVVNEDNFSDCIK
jgi:hypothetical protein